MGEQVSFGESLEGILDKGGNRGNVLISHGAGGDMRMKVLQETAERLASIGFLVLRWNFGYVTRGGAPSFQGKTEQPQMISAIDFLRGQNEKAPVILIGKSFGGRISTFIVDRSADIAGFVFYGLPLQGAGKAAKPRDWSHLRNLTGRALFVTGEKDKLCSREQLIEAQRFVQIPFESEFVPGDHSFKPKGESVAVEKCVNWIDRFF